MTDCTIYYLGRVIKLGNLTADMVISAIQEPRTVNWWSNGWSFLDATEGEVGGVKYVCAKLSKFNPEGEVVIADTDSNQEIVQSEPNLRLASSFFIYIPSVSGVAFAKVAHHIDEFQFPRRFCQIVNETYDNFFVDCQIKMISDLQTFAAKLLSLDTIEKIAATIHPPNPLFGPLWEPLKEYIRKRRTSKMTLSEKAAGGESLSTDLPKHVEEAAKQTSEHQYQPKEDLPVGDAAILMAADGYGSGTVQGRRASERVVIRTSETIKNFSLKSEHSNEELFLEAYRILKDIEETRHMEHGPNED